MKKILIFLIFVAASVNGQEYNLLNGITLTAENRHGSITLVMDGESDLRSGFNKGRIIRYSNDENNATNLGKFVEVDYELGYIFEGTFTPQGNITVIFSNLKEIYVTENTILSQGDIIGKTKKGAGNDFRLFLLSVDDLPILRNLTNNRKIQLGDYWAWDPSFMLRR